MPTAYVQGPSGVTQPGEDNQQEPRRTPTASRQFADLVFESGGQKKNVEDEPGEWASSGWAMWDPSWSRACCETGSTWSFGTLDLDRSAAAQVRRLEADEAEVRRLAGLVTTAGRSAVDCPVSGGCHRAATGNISIFAGCDRFTFERILPVLVTMGRHILHTGRWAQPRSSRWSPTTWLPPTWCPCAKL